VTVDLAALDPDVAQFWTGRHLCSLTTLQADGSPHVVPVGVALDPDEGCAWVITRRGSAKVRHVRGDPRVAANQVDGGRWATLEGLAEVCQDALSVDRAVLRYAGRYRQPRPNPERVALRITPVRLLVSAGLGPRTRSG
jgi:PPOX class probable F420-dependent enzyme